MIALRLYESSRQEILLAEPPALRIGSTYALAESLLPLILLEVRREPLAVVVPAGYPLAGRGSAGFEDVRAERLILTEDGCSFRRYLLEEFTVHDCTPRIAMELDSLPAVRQAVLNGLGIGFLPALLADRCPGLAAVPYTGGQAAMFTLAIRGDHPLCTSELLERVRDAVPQTDRQDS